MKKELFEKIYDKAFVPVLIGSLSFIGYLLYNQGACDAVHKIYENGWTIVDENDDNLEFVKRDHYVKYKD